MLCLMVPVPLPKLSSLLIGRKTLRAQPPQGVPLVATVGACFGMINFCPTLMLSVFKLLAARMARTVVR